MSAVWEQQIAIPILPSGQFYTADVVSDFFRAEGAVGLKIVLRVRVAATGTLAIRLLGREPFEGTEYAVNVDATVGTTGTFVWEFGPGGARQPDGEGAPTVNTLVAQFVNVPPPDPFKIHVEKSDGSNWEFGVGFQRVPG